MSFLACKTETPVEPQEPAKSEITTEEAVASKPESNVDQRSYLQELINKSAAAKQELLLPAGRYVISDELILPSNIAINGVGPTTEIILTAGSKVDRHVFTIRNNTANVMIKNLRINGNLSGNTGARLVPLFVGDGVNGLTFKNIIVEGGRDYGAAQVKGIAKYPARDLQFIGCTFTGTGGPALELRGTVNALVQNCTFTNWGIVNKNCPGFSLQSEENKNIQILNNTFNNTVAVQFGLECAGAYVSDAIISGNKFNDPNNLGGNGVSGYYRRTQIIDNIFTGGIGTHRSGLEIFGQNNTISRNSILAGNIALSSGNLAFPGTSPLREDAYGTVVSNNIIKTRGTNAAGISIGGGCCTIHDLKVQNNDVNTTAANGNSSAIVVGANGMNGLVKNITVDGNTLRTNANCIRMQSLPGSQDIYLTNNICKQGSAWLTVITNTFKNIVAKGNVIEISNKNVNYSVAGTPAVSFQ